jgi:phage terminase small subunit
MENESSSKELNSKQKKFCEEYIFDFNGTRAAKAAGYSAATAYSIASENLRKPEVKAYIEELESDLARIAGISRLRVLKEHEKLAFSSIAHLHNTWIQRKEFEQLTDDQNACIAEISTQTRREQKPGQPAEIIEFVKVKLYDKQKSLDAINKMLGFDAAQKIDLTSKGEKISQTPEIKVFNTAPPLAGSEDKIDGK